jgi:hypothetical protein
MLVRRLGSALVAAVLAASADGAVARAASWRVASSFGVGGVAALPVRERLEEPPNQGASAPPERYRSLLVPGPHGSIFVGGYAKGRPGAFLVSRISPAGRLVTSFGDGGVSLVPAIHWVRQAPPRMYALAGGGVLIVGINRADALAAVRLNESGQPARGFGHDGVAQYKVPHAHRFSIVTAAAVEPNGDILAVYQKELPQPENAPRVPEGQGNGAIEFVRLLPSGALDRSFGKGGLLAATGERPGFIEGESGTVGACAETLSASGSLLVAYENLALEELDSAGAVVTSFGDELSPETRVPSAPPFETKNDYHFCNALFALPGGSVEGVSSLESRASGVEVTRLTSSGLPDDGFGTGGSTRIDVPAEAAAVAPNGETYTAGRSGRSLVLAGILANGHPDPALGGARGRRYQVAMPRAAGSVPGDEEKPTWEVLPVANGLVIRVGEEVVRVRG